jgi:hypothetical protein
MGGEMDIFISWSGARSHAAASALARWLPKVVNAFHPWLSSSDIDKGARWSVDVAKKLERATVGIICLTPSNVHSDWILFEAGALSKTLGNTYVCPLLIGLAPAQLDGPLAQFQATRATKQDILSLTKTLNSALGHEAMSESHVQEVFEVWWPKLEEELKSLPADDSGARPKRADREILEEILAIVRNQNRAPQSVVLGNAPEDSIVLTVMRYLEALGQNVQSIRLKPNGDSRIELEVQRSDGVTFPIFLPKNIPLASVAPNVRLQLPKPLSHPDKASKQKSVSPKSDAKT